MLEPTQENKALLIDSLHPYTVDLLEIFEYDHLPEHLQDLSKPFHDLAWRVVQTPTERWNETLTCLRKLREAKDCAVTMGVPVGKLSSLRQ